jgi:hypothetical protein
MEGESWKGESPGIPDFEAPFLYVEAVCPRNFGHFSPNATGRLTRDKLFCS